MPSLFFFSSITFSRSISLVTAWKCWVARSPLPNGLNRQDFRGSHMCDFMVRRLGSNQHWYAVQCNLPINMYNEKIFLCLWFWLIILMVLDVLSVISWIVSLNRNRRMTNISKYLSLTDPVLANTERQPLTSESFWRMARVAPRDAGDFVDYLKLDGYLVFELLARNTNELMAGKIAQRLDKGRKRLASVRPYSNWKSLLLALYLNFPSRMLLEYNCSVALRSFSRQVTDLCIVRNHGIDFTP